MKSRRLGVVMAVAGLLAATPSLADEILYFTNGTTMAVRNHTIDKDKDMISVDLGNGARMGFPTYMVDKIESGGRDVFLNPTYHPSNQAVAGVPNAGGSGGGNAAASLDQSSTVYGTPPPRFRSASPRRRAMAGESAEEQLLGGTGGGSDMPPASRPSVNAGVRRIRAYGDRSNLIVSSPDGISMNAPAPQALMPAPGSGDAGGPTRPNLTTVQPRGVNTEGGGESPQSPPSDSQPEPPPPDSGTEEAPPQ